MCWTRVTVAVFNEQCVRVCVREREGGGGDGGSDGGVIPVQANNVISPTQTYATCKKPITEVASSTLEN